MRRRFSLLALAAVLLTASPASAEPGSWADAPEKLPRAARGDRIKNLDFLFEALKAAPDADSAKLVESRIWALWLASGSDTNELLMTDRQRVVFRSTKNLHFLFEALKAAPDADSARLVESLIWALWLASGSDTTDLLMTRVKTAIDGKDTNLAIELLDAVVELRPDYVEAWNRRATLHFAHKNYGKSLGDTRRVLAREPRHFGALSGLGVIMQEFGEEKLALEAFRRALAVNPHLQKIPRSEE